MAASLNVFTVATIFLTLNAVVSGSEILESNERIVQEFSSSELTSRMWKFGEKSPVCVLYSRSSKGTDVSKLEKSFYKLAQVLADVSSFTEWTLGYFNTTNQTLPPSAHPTTVPCLQCHIGTAMPVVYSPQGTQQPSVKSIRRWMKITVGHAFLARISPVQSSQLSAILSEHDSITVIGVPGYLYHQILESTLKEVASKWRESVNLFMVLPSTDDERNITKTFGLKQFPSVLVFQHQVREERKKPVVLLQGPLDTAVSQIDLELTIRQCQATLLNKANFQAEVLDTSFPQAPMAVTFYSPRNPASLDYLYMLDKTIKKFAKIDPTFRFGLVNLVQDSQVIDRYVDDASFVIAVPFTVVFWQEDLSSAQEYPVKQKLFDKVMPVAQDLYDFLRAHDVPLAEDQDRDQPWQDEKDTCDPYRVVTQCSAHDNTTYPPVYGPAPAPYSWKIKTRIRTKRRAATHNIPYVTDRTWAAAIEHSVPPPQTMYSGERTAQAAKAHSLALVVFIREGCGYCDKIIPVLEEINKSIGYVGASLYLMNCSSDPVHCSQQGITGFPTLTAFRSLSWSAAERCFPTSHRSRYIRIDYHGAILLNLVLEWLSDINRPAVNKTFFHEDLPSDFGDDDVRLVATLYSRTLARRYLSSTLYNRWYPYDCYNLICELLYGMMPCYALYTRDVVDYVSKSKTVEKELVVSKLMMQRVDGVHAKLFELGYTLESSLNDGGDTRLHQFHHTHRYNISSSFKCEDDHASCNDVILQFVSDHKRLPVSHITAAAFHTKTGTHGGHTDHIFIHELPVMLVLAHRANITRDSSFYKEVTQAAYALYRDMVFVTLNVDEFSFWASNFVPKGYRDKYAFGDSTLTPPLYHYPRLCIVRWEDHQHAAFYPPVNELDRMGTKIQARLNRIDSQQIIQFAQQYLTDPQRLKVRTEMF